MNILFDIGHPAHVHYYRNVVTELLSKGHKVTWTIKEIEVVRQLLNHYGFSYHVFPKKSDSLVGKTLMQLRYDWMLLQLCWSEQIDIAIGTSVSVAHVSKLSRVNSIMFDDDDDEVQPLVTKYVSPYASTLVSPDVLRGKRKRKDTLFFPGYMELAYLHPKRFTPNPLVLHEIGVNKGEPFFIMRFNAFKAHHDVGIKGLSLEQKLKLIEILKPHGKIFITTERNIEPELRQYQMSVSPEKAHSLLAYAKIFIGDSQTMTSEAAVMGIPSLRCNSFAGRISYLEEQENRYGLTFGFLPDHFDKLLTKLNELLCNPNLKAEWQEKRQRMLNDKIDVTSFMFWFIETYPASVDQITDNSEFWTQFR